MKEFWNSTVRDFRGWNVLAWHSLPVMELSRLSIDGDVIPNTCCQDVLHNIYCEDSAVAQWIAVWMFYWSTVSHVNISVHHWCVCSDRPVWTREHCRVSPSRFPAECCKTQLNQGCFVFAVLCLFLVMSVFDLCFVTYFPTYTDVNGTVWPNCADVP